MDPTDDDLAIVDRAMAGDRNALETLWRTHRPWLASVLLGHAGPGRDLDDLLQETAVAFVRGIGSLGQPAALRAWLRSVAVHTAISARRRARLRDQEAAGDRLELVADPAAAGREQRAARRSELDSVLAALAALDPKYGEPLLLKTVHGWSQKRIAATLALTESAVETRLARARRMLRAGLAEAGDPPSAPNRETEPWTSTAKTF